MTETWLDIIPAIPLARGVPVVALDADPGEDARHGVVARVLPAADERRVPMAVYCDGFYGGQWTSAVEDLRPDLDDPQGFGYALRWVAPRYTHTMRNHFAAAPCDTIDNLIMIWVQAWSQVTDADRLALAKALREVA